MGVAGDARVHRDPARVAAHHLDDHDALVRFGRGVQPIDRLGGDGDGGVEAERRLRARQVVVDRLRHADDRHALLEEPARDAERAVAADRDQRVDADLAEPAHDLVGDVDGHLLAVALGDELERVALVDGAEDRAAEVGDAAHLGGTILGTAKRGTPFKYYRPHASGELAPVDRSAEVIQRFKDEALRRPHRDGRRRLDAPSRSELVEKGCRSSAYPRPSTTTSRARTATFGFDTAVTIATEAIDRLHTTAESHERIMVVEVMGRYAGWIALHAGVAGGADVILIPEIPYDIEPVVEKDHAARDARGRRFSIVVVAEGAGPWTEASAHRRGLGRAVRWAASPSSGAELGRLTG